MWQVIAAVSRPFFENLDQSASRKCSSAALFVNTKLCSAPGIMKKLTNTFPGLEKLKETLTECMSIVKFRNKVLPPLNGTSEGWMILQA